MPHHSDDREKNIRDTIIGLGERSIKKSYFPELKKKLVILENFRNKYETLIEATNTAYFLLDENGVIKEINDEFLRFLNMAEEKNVLQEELSVFVTDDYKNSWQAEFSRCKESGFIRNFEVDLIVRESENMAVSINAALIIHPHSKDIIAIANDIRPRKRNEAILKKNEALFRTLFEGTFEALSVLQNEKVILANQKYYSLLDISPGHEEASFDRIFVEKKDQNLSSVIDNFIKKNLGHTSFQCKGENKKGKPLFLEVNLTAISWENNPAVFINLRDISQKIEFDQKLAQAQKMESIGTLAGGIAHDFNNLLTVILGGIELIKDGVDESYAEYLVDIENAGKRAADLTRQLLAFSRKQMLRTQPLDINTSITSLLKMLNRLLGEQIKLEVNLASDLSLVMADSSQIDQVIMNLVVNARDAIKEIGEIKIKTKMVHFDEERISAVDVKPGFYVQISIEDNGCGMDKKVMSKIFEPFFTTKELSKGTGLGLPVVYGVVEQHGGWINVYSEKGQGSVFHIYLPALSNVEIEEEKTLYKKKKELQGNNQKILFVEDEKSLSMLVCKFLQRKGFQVVCMRNAQTALDAFNEHDADFDLVFTDVVLPDKNGFELFNELRAINKNIKILFSSGYTDDKSRWQEINRLGYRFIQKPYSLEKLVKVLLEILNEE